jgi:hypothetical protein
MGKLPKGMIYKNQYLMVASMTFDTSKTFGELSKEVSQIINKSVPIIDQAIM